MYLFSCQRDTLSPHRKNHLAMTLMELLIVVSLISVISLAVYNAFANGLRIWERTQRLVMEEDIVIFFDKLSQDLRNSFSYSLIPYEGGISYFAFPSTVEVESDSKSGITPKGRIVQMGRVQYYYDLLEKRIYRQQANYGQTQKDTFAASKQLVEYVDRLSFRYIYLTDNEEVYSQEVLEIVPSGIEVEVMFSDSLGQRIMRKLIDIPTGI